MRLFDPDRPRLQGRPLYPAAKPRYAVPDLSISFTEHELVGALVTVSAMLCVGENRFSWFHSGPLPSVGAMYLFSDWLHDPEEVMQPLRLD
jgi:hypothetical protein